MERKLDDYELIRDTGLFVGQKIFEFSLSGSYEFITNLLQTIKEYRDYAQPDSPNWVEYIKEIFHIFGFTTEALSQRLILLSNLGSCSDPNGIVGVILPHEDFEKIVPWLDWVALLDFAASKYSLEWAILTNGIYLKIFNLHKRNFADFYFWANVEGIIEKNREDSFFILF